LRKRRRKTANAGIERKRGVYTSIKNGLWEAGDLTASQERKEYLKHLKNKNRGGGRESSSESRNFKSGERKRILSFPKPARTNSVGNTCRARN